MSVRAKFKVQKIDCGTVKLEAVIGGSPENDAFFQATPYGQMEIGTVNPKALEQFEVGAEYYIDFTKAS